MSYTILENSLSVLESGSLESKHVALSHLLNAARNGTVFDVDRLVICLINADHAETVQKIFVLLSHLAIQDESCKRRLCKISAIYHLVLKILSSRSAKKMIGVFYFLLAVLHLDESDLLESIEEIKTEINEAKDKVRGMGILNQICALFLQINADSAVWQSLCQCLAECCTDSLNNQTESSHILPKCLKQLEGSFKIDLVNLVIALTYNNRNNQEQFILLGGVQCIARNFLNTYKGIELLCVSMTNYPPAVQEAKMCNLVPLIEAIHANSKVENPSINQVMLSKWCSLALAILATSELQNPDGIIKLAKNPRNLPTNNKCFPKKGKKHFFETRKSKIPIIDMESSAKNTIGSSFLSKFDAINSFPSDSPNKIRPSIYNSNSKTFQETRQTQGKHFGNQWNMSFHANNDWDKFNFTPQWFNGENSCMEFSHKGIESFIFKDGDKKNNKENSSTLGNTSGSVDEAFLDFKPAFTSSPLKMDDSRLSDQRNRSIFKIPAHPKRFQEQFHGQLLKSNSEEPKRHQNKNKPQSEIGETIKSTASSKVRQLVKQVIDTQNKFESINGNNKENILFYLKPEGWTRIPNTSQIENGNELNDNDENSNKILGFNISVKHNNNTTIREKVPEVKKTNADNDKLNLSVSSCASVTNNTTIREKNPEFKKTIPDNNKLDSSVSSCISVGSQTSFEPNPIFSENNKASIKCKPNLMNLNSKNIIKRLRIGVSLYGCDFQKISKVLWSKEEHVSAKFLYAVYCKHIVRK